MLWYATVEMTGELTDDDIIDIASDKPTSIDYNHRTQAAEVRLTVDADTYDRAVHEALGAFGSMANIQRLLAAGALSQPRRFVIADEKAEEQSLAILSTAAVAERLGVSAARVRQLKDEPDFPRPFPIPGAAGDFYYTAEIDAYARRRRPGSQAQGKPRAGDEELLNFGLAALRDGWPMPRTDLDIVERALATSGGPSVNGKARVLVQFARYADGARGVDERYVEALARAREICQA